MSGRSLHASINHTTMDTLHEVAGLWRFQYAPDWLGTPACFALAAQATQAATTQGCGQALRLRAGIDPRAGLPLAATCAITTATTAAGRVTTPGFDIRISG